MIDQVCLPSGLVLRSRGVSPPVGSEIIEERDVLRAVTILWFRLVPGTEPILLGEVTEKDVILGSSIEVDWDAVFIECQRRYPRGSDDG